QTSARAADTALRRRNTGGTKNNLDHEGVRTRGREPSDDLQLALVRQNRIRSHGRGLGPHLRGHALARPEPSGSPGVVHRRVAGRAAEPGLMPGRRGEKLLARGPMEESAELRILFHRLNNQLGIILANAELLESKATDDVHRARAAQVVTSALEAMGTA